MRQLFQQLPTTTYLFCVIDGITYYERPPKRSRFIEAIEAILAMMKDCNNVIVKLLLSCHGRSNFIRRSVDDKDILLVPSEIDGDGQGWSDRTWNRKMGNDIDALGNSTTNESGSRSLFEASEHKFPA
jgi:hypothetical protein